MIKPDNSAPSSARNAPGDPPFELGRGRLGFALTRLKLMVRSFKSGWSIFVESRLGMLSLLTVLLFALMAVSHPILMMTVWDSATYDPVTGYAFGQVEQPAPPSLKHLLGTARWGGTY